MKYLSKLFLAFAVILSFTACKKVADLPFYKNGTAVALTSSVNTISTAPADSGKNVIQLSWTDPKYSQDPSLYKYVVEIDSTGRNFSKEYTLTVTGAMDTSLSGKQFNDIMAGLGIVGGAPASVDVRVTSSYSNNNESYTSNVLTINATPYVVPITATTSSAAPLTLSIGNAASSALVLNWNATQYGNLSFTYKVQVDVNGNNFANAQSFDVEAGATKKDISVGDLNSAAILAGVTAGTAKDLEFRVVAFLGAGSVPSVISNIIKINVTTYIPFLYLWVPGDYQNWSPDVAPTLGATTPDLNNFEGYVYVVSGGTYKFKFTNAPDWNHTGYGDGGANILSTSGDNLTWPNGGAYYYVKANPVALTWFAMPAAWAIIGDATPGGWDNDTQMTYDVANKVWVINSVALNAGSIKFRANGEWNNPNLPGGNSNLGGSLNALSYGGGNISVAAAGNYKIVLDLSHPLKYTATLTKL